MNTLQRSIGHEQVVADAMNTAQILGGVVEDYEQGIAAYLEVFDDCLLTEEAHAALVAARENLAQAANNIRLLVIAYQAG